MNRFLNPIYSLMGMALGRKSNIEIGKNTSVRWWKLRAYGGKLRIGVDSMIGCRVDFDGSKGEITIGDRCFIGASHLVCHSKIHIGNDVLISWGVTVVDHDSHSTDWDLRKNDVRDWKARKKNWKEVAVAPVYIGDKVWIGFGATILKGVRVGEGAVIGAQSVVTRNVPDYTIVCGNPGRIVRSLPKPKISDLDIFTQNTHV